MALVAACSKSEPPPAPKPRASAPSAAAAPAAAPAQPGEIDEGLKERLARQEAAARMFESKVLNPPAPRVPEPPPPAVKAAAAPTAPAPQASPAAPPAQQAPAQPRAEPRPEPPKVAAPAPASPPPPRTDLAAARASPAPVPTAPRLVARVDPDFPREAIQAGVDQGNVKARMTLDSGGNVARVEILEASPRRVFDRAVVRALSQWRYNDGAAGRTVDMEVAFRR